MIGLALEAKGSCTNEWHLTTSILCEADFCAELVQQNVLIIVVAPEACNVDRTCSIIVWYYSMGVLQHCTALGTVCTEA